MICRDDEIVRPLRKRWDKCNRLVVGSNPTRGVSKSLKLEFSSFRFFVFIFRYVFLECRCKHFTCIMSYGDIITIEPDKRGGKPCIRRMRITVYDVLGWLASGMSMTEIIDDFPELTETDIRLSRVCGPRSSFSCFGECRLKLLFDQIRRVGLLFCH